MISNARALERATRIGFAARGIMYGLIGYLALRSGRTEDGAGIIDHLNSGGGRIIVFLMAGGFFAYGAWRLLDAWADSSRRGNDAKGLAERGGAAVSGLLHLALGGVALLAAAKAGGGSGGDSMEQGAQTALDLPGGGLILILAAAALAATGLVQFGKAWKLGFLRNLDQRAAGRSWIAWLGRAGFAARGAVFLIIAWFFWRAGMEHSSGLVGGLEEALNALPSTLQMVVAGGLLLFGLFSLVEARFRRIGAPHTFRR